MTDQEDNFNSGKVVFNDKNCERESWTCLGQTCSRSLIVLLSQLSVILFIIFGCFCRVQLSETCGVSTVSVGILRIAAGYILFSSRLRTSLFWLKNCIFVSVIAPSKTGESHFIHIWLESEIFIPSFDKTCFFSSTFQAALRCHAKRNWNFPTCSRCKLWIYWFAEKQRYKVIVICSQFLWGDFQFKSICWDCHHWTTWRIEEYLH